MSQFESVGQILPRAVKRGITTDNFLALQAREAFPKALNDIFGKQKLPKVSAGKFSYGTLTVLVPDPAWSGLLRQKEAAILKKLNSLLGQKLVEKLRFRVVAK